ncbi:MAG: YraN family protein [Clostridia bacterium]|nr:YraN family protein [Clostridia bacterium]
MNTKTVGNKGEAIVSQYLREKGYIISATNYHSRFGEIDIIAENNSVIAFVEVKTRNNNALTLPREWVDLKKQQKIKLTALQYLAHNFCEGLQVRFDVAEIIYQNKTCKINYIESAFSGVE